MSDTTKTLDEAIKDLNKKYNDGAIAKTVDFERSNVKAIPTACFSLDYIFGCGGLPEGRIIEIFGAESSGKSTLALYLIAQAQKHKKKTAFIDAEFAFSNEYAESIGVNTGDLYVSQPETGEEAFDIAENIIKTGEMGLIVIDSVAALLPGAEMEKNVEDATIALQARLMSKGLRRSSVRIEVKRGKKIKDGEDVVGNWLEICAVKNKVAIPFRSSSMELIFGKGVDLEGDLLDNAEKCKVIQRSSSVYTFEDKHIGSGRDKVKEILVNDRKLFDKIKKKLIEKI
jgi:recombination protein RecA